MTFLAHHEGYVNRVVRQTKFLVADINHFTRWETLEETNENILSRVSKEKGKIRKIWTENMYES